MQAGKGDLFDPAFDPRNRPERIEGQPVRDHGRATSVAPPGGHQDATASPPARNSCECDGENQQQQRPRLENVVPVHDADEPIRHDGRRAASGPPRRRAAIAVAASSRHRKITAAIANGTSPASNGRWLQRSTRWPGPSAASGSWPSGRSCRAPSARAALGRAPRC